jgi:predicted GNAT family acetyltransferase
MEFAFTRDHAEFARSALPLLESRIEWNLLATVLTGMLDAVPGSPGPVLAAGVERGAVTFVAMRSPAHAMLATELPAQQAPRLVAEWLERDPELPGVGSLPGTARAIAAAWSRHTGGTTRCGMREALHSLDHVRDPPRPAQGALRLAESRERSLLVDWMRAFAIEAGVPDVAHAAQLIDRALAAGGLLVWEHGGPVAFVRMQRPVSGVVRIGPVYTPPENRRRGYASAAVAAVSRLALARGARRCMLFTDLANPTSNKIYAEVGYVRFADWEEHAFARG